MYIIYVKGIPQPFPVSEVTRNVLNIAGAGCQFIAESNGGETAEYHVESTREEDDAAGLCRAIRNALWAALRVKPYGRDYASSDDRYFNVEASYGDGTKAGRDDVNSAREKWPFPESDSPKGEYHLGTGWVDKPSET